jgi:hypothetical protein
MEPKPIDLVCKIDTHQLEPDVAAPPEIPRPKRFLERLRRSQNVLCQINYPLRTTYGIKIVWT